MNLFFVILFIYIAFALIAAISIYGKNKPIVPKDRISYFRCLASVFYFIAEPDMHGKRLIRLYPSTQPYNLNNPKKEKEKEPNYQPKATPCDSRHFDALFINETKKKRTKFHPRRKAIK